MFLFYIMSVYQETTTDIFRPRCWLAAAAEAAAVTWLRMRMLAVSAPLIPNSTSDVQYIVVSLSICVNLIHVRPHCLHGSEPVLDNGALAFVCLSFFFFVILFSGYLC